VITDRPRIAPAAPPPAAPPAAPEGQPPPRPRQPGDILGQWWFAACTITLIVASDYKLRTRSPRDTLGGSVDSLIILELALYAIVGVYLIFNHARPPRVARTQAHLYLASMFVGLMVLSVLYTAYPEYALVRASQMCVLLGLTLVAARKATRADMHRFVHAYIVLICISVVYGVARPSPPVTNLQAGRFSWFAIHPTVSGVLAGLATLAVISYLAAGKNHPPGPHWRRPLYWGALALCGGGTLASQTRGAVVGTLVGSVIVLVALRGGKALIELQAILLVVFLGIGLAFGGQVVKYFERGEKAEQLSSLNSRTNLWETAADAIEKKPMFGYGVTSSRGIFYDALGLGGGHNAIVNVFVELGLVGFIIWASLVFALVVGVRRLPIRSFPQIRFDRALLLGVITFLMIDGIFFEGPGSVTNVASTWFFVCIAWLAVCRRTVVEDARAAIPPPPPVVSTRELSVDELLQLRRIVEKKSG
jgi:O-antigen ligase